MFRKILIVALFFLTSHTVAQNFEAILSDTRLPIPVLGPTVVYDGEDSIYVLGGYGADHNHQTDILKFSVTTQVLEKVGTMDPVIYGSAVWTGNKNILFFGGYNGSEYQSKVWSYKPDGANDWTQVGDLPRNVGHTSSVWDQGEYSYVFGGHDRYGILNPVSRFSSVTNASTVVGALTGPTYGTSAVWDETTGDAYVFGGHGADVEWSNDITKFNPTDNTVVTLNVTLPLGTYDSCGVWTGAEAYIIGGTITFEEVADIVRFNPSTNEVLSVPVKNLPRIFYAHDCAFVKKLNRVYVFGGASLQGSTRGDEIMYINLGASSTNPTTTTPITTPPTTSIVTTTATVITTTINEAGQTRFPDPHYWLLVLFVCFHL